MKKLIISMALGLAVTTYADFTSFRWESSTPALDPFGTAIETGEATVFTISDDDPSTFVGGGWIDISDIMSLDSISADSIAVGPSFLGSPWSNYNYIDGDGSRAGSTVYAMVVLSPGLSSLGDIQVGDYIGIASGSGTIVDLQPSPSNPAASPQIFDPGTIQWVNIPEPSTIGMMGVFGIAMLLIRKKSFR